MNLLIQVAQADTGNQWTGIAFIAGGAAIFGAVMFFVVNRKITKRGNCSDSRNIQG